jgi:hypothetical protein
MTTSSWLRSSGWLTGGGAGPTPIAIHATWRPAGRGGSGKKRLDRTPDAPQVMVVSGRRVAVAVAWLEIALGLADPASIFRQLLDPRAFRNEGRSEPPVASVLGESFSHCAGLHLGLEFGDELLVPLCLTVHGVLQPLHELLEVRQSRFECLELFRLPIVRVAPPWAGRGDDTADLPDPCGQSVAVTHQPTPPG